MELTCLSWNCKYLQDKWGSSFNKTILVYSVDLVVLPTSISMNPKWTRIYQHVWSLLKSFSFVVFACSTSRTHTTTDFCVNWNEWYNNKQSAYDMQNMDIHSFYALNVFGMFPARAMCCLLVCHGGSLHVPEQLIWVGAWHGRAAVGGELAWMQRS